MSAVLEVTYRTDSEYELLSLTIRSLIAQIYDSVQYIGHICAAEPFSYEFGCRVLEAVGDDEILFDMSEAPAGSQCDDDLV